MKKDEIKLSDKFWEKVYKFKCKDGYIYSFVFGQKEVFSQLVALEAKIEELYSLESEWDRWDLLYDLVAEKRMKYESQYLELGKQQGLI